MSPHSITPLLYRNAVSEHSTFSDGESSNESAIEDLDPLTAPTDTHSFGLDPVLNKLKTGLDWLQKSNGASMTALLPMILRLKGKPYTLRDYFPFEPLFRADQPNKLLVKSGRQCSKSTSLAAQLIIRGFSTPNYNQLVVTPLFEMIRRFSTNYVRPFIETSPINNLFKGGGSLGNVLQRTFSNESTIFFSYAFLDCERIRGLSVSRTVYDEVQDMNKDFIPIIRETMSAAKHPQETYAGTCKSLDNTIEMLWQQSSQAEWVIRCQSCRHYNIPSLEHHLLDMIGPYSDDISEERPAIICANKGCRNPVNAREGRWVHAYPNRRWDFAGYHVPQIIMPMHYASPEKWRILLGKQSGLWDTTAAQFFNEVCGESYDEGSKLVTQTDLINACVLPWVNDADEACKHIGGYINRIVSVDWGGGGGRIGSDTSRIQRRLRSSFTVATVLGMRADGKIDVIWAHRSLRTHDMEYEARLCIEAVRKFKCTHIVHDYGGAGSVREWILIQAGFPAQNIIPVSYHPAARRGLVVFYPADPSHPRDRYSVDKSRSLVTTCQCIKQGIIRFFKYEEGEESRSKIIHDFLSLIEEKIDSRMGTDVYVITHNANQPDDFAQAVNIGSVMLWHMSGTWPDLAQTANFNVPRDVLSRTTPPAHADIF